MVRFYLLFQWKMHVYIPPACSIDWILDSGASHHVTPSKDNFVAYNSGDYGKVHLGNNHFCNIVGVGDVQIKKNDGKYILLKQVRHIPEMHMSLISVG
jgi:hypothetical protein